MAHNSQAEKQYDLLEAQIRECFGRVAWTHKTQEKCADRLNKKDSQFKWLQIILSGLTTTAFFATLFGNNEITLLVGTVISVILFVINTYLKENDLGKTAKSHSETASKIWNIRESYLSLITDIKSRSLTVDEVKEKRDNLQAELVGIYEIAPRTNGEAYGDASDALKNNEELTFSDKEIDVLLPKNLRKKK